MKHIWKFYRYEGVDQVVLQSADDLRHLKDLDRKLWMVLTLPVKGTTLDPATCALVDADHDGRIHREELLAALDWELAALRDPALLLEPGDAIPLSNIADEKILASVKDTLRRIEKPDADAITFDEARRASEAFAKTFYNGDGVVRPESMSDNPVAKELVEAAAKVVPGVNDRSGDPGVNADSLAEFRKQAQAMLAWLEATDASCVKGLDAAATAKAAAALHAVEAKVEDYFTRCRLADFDAKAADPLNRSAADYQAIAGDVLSGATAALADFPLAAIAPEKPLPLLRHVNPAWAPQLAALAADAARPVLGDDALAELTEEQWSALKAALAPYDAHVAAKPAGAIADFDAETLRRLLADEPAAAIAEAIAKDLEFAPQAAVVDSVEKLLRLRRDMPVLLTNFVSFIRFYAGERAVFQTGVLYMDGRSCDLCIDVTDPGKHGTMAPLSGFYLAYCDLVNADGAKKQICVAFTDGDNENLMVGRNGVFVDVEGKSWDATVAKIVTAPVSIREAFWSPYKKFVRMIEDQIAKRASAADAAATARVESSATAVVDSTATPAAPAAAPAEGAAPKKLDLGTIALIGTAIGGISALLAGFLKTLFGLGWWIPLGVVGVILLISGPSMILAALKLKRRNLAPLLDANGWAINTRARINIPFASHLTRLARLPEGTIPSVRNPFEDPKRRRAHAIRWTIAILVILAILLGVAWRLGLGEWISNRTSKNVATPDQLIAASAEKAEAVSEEAAAAAAETVAAAEETGAAAAAEAVDAPAAPEAAPPAEAPAEPAAETAP